MNVPSLKITILTTVLLAGLTAQALAQAFPTGPGYSGGHPTDATLDVYEGGGLYLVPNAPVVPGNVVILEDPNLPLPDRHDPSNWAGVLEFPGGGLNAFVYTGDFSTITLNPFDLFIDEYQQPPSGGGTDATYYVAGNNTYIVHLNGPLNGAGIPEPSTIALWCVGLLSLFAAHRRRTA